MTATVVEAGWAGVLAGCVDPSLCPGREGCAAAAGLWELLSTPVSGELAVLLESVEFVRFSPREQPLLLQLWDRLASWSQHRRDDAALAVMAAAEQVLEQAHAQLVDPTPAQTVGHRLARALEPGRDEVAVALRLSPRSVAGRLTRARALRDDVRAPGLAGLVELGQTGGWHAQVLLDLLADVPDEVSAAVVGDRRVQEQLRAGTPGSITACARRVLARLAPSQLEEAARKDRDVWRRPLPDGMAEIGARLSAADAAAVWARLQAAVHEAKAAGDARTAGQVRADLVAAFGWHGLRPLDATPAAATAPVLARVGVVIDLASLLALREQPGEVTGFGPVSAETVRRLLAQDGTDVQRLLTDGTGLLLGASRGYRIPAELARTARARYDTCTAYGCTQPAERCDLDHCQPWERRAPDSQPRVSPSQGSQAHGATCLGNLHPLCRRHHLAKTHAGWRPSLDPVTAAVTWTTPLGQQVTVAPHDYRWQDPPDDEDDP